MKNTQLLICVLGLALCIQSHAHKRWLLPSDFTLSVAETVVVDFTASNNLFYPDKAMPLSSVVIRGPNGTEQTMLNPYKGARRNSFELDVQQAGSYRVMSLPPVMHFVQYSMPNENQPRRDRGSKEALLARLPKDASNISWAESLSLIETFITLEQESALSAIPSHYKGISLRYRTHPSVLYTDEPLKLTVNFDGRAMANQTVYWTHEGTRYRDQLATQSAVTDDNGHVELQFDTAGRYLIEVELERAPADNNDATQYFSYFATVEVN